MSYAEDLAKTLLEAAVGDWRPEPPNAARIAEEALLDSLRPNLRNQHIALDRLYVPEKPLCWPSTLNYIETHCGGFYGVTTFAAEKGTGKTFLSTASAIEAAASGEWQVFFYLAEDDFDGWMERFNIYLNANPGTEACIPRLRVEHVGRNQTPERLTAATIARIDYDADLPVLIVIDSINSVVNLGNRPYLAALHEFGLWAMLARRLSRGRVSFLLTSETNKTGESKGEQLPFWSDVYIKLKKKSKNVVEMFLDKTRRTGGEGPMGKYVRQWNTGRFLSEDEVQWHPRIVSPPEPPPVAFGLDDRDEEAFV